MCLDVCMYVACMYEVQNIITIGETSIHKYNFKRIKNVLGNQLNANVSNDPEYGKKIQLKISVTILTNYQNYDNRNDIDMLHD